MKYRIQRHGSLIGEYDETTLRALLAAGAVKLSDDCVAGDSEDTVAHILYGYATTALEVENLEDQRWSLALLLITTATLAMLLWFTARSQVTSNLSAITSQPEPGYKSVTFVHQDAQSEKLRDALPMTASDVAQIVEASLVTVIALNNEERPLCFGSGVVIGDGLEVAIPLATVRGAASVELHFSDGHMEKPMQALLLPACPEVLVFRLKNRGVPLPWPTEASPKTSALDCFLVGSSLCQHPQLVPLTHEASTDRWVGADDAQGAVMVSAFGNLVGLAKRNADGTRSCIGDVELSKAQEVGKEITIGSAEWPTIAEQDTAPRIAIDDIREDDDELSVKLRNCGTQPLSRVLLRVIFHELPAEEHRTATLEKTMRETAISVSNLEGDVTRVDEGAALVMTWLKPLDVAPSEWTAAQTAQLPEASILDGDEHNPLANSVEAVRTSVSSHDGPRIEQAVSEYQHRVREVLEALASTRRVVADQWLKQKQKLREITQTLESTRLKGAAAIAEARKRVRKNEDEVLEVDLLPGVPQEFVLATKPVSGWQAEAYVLSCER
jgi:hypothetical protein